MAERAAVERIISDALHEDCGGSREICGAGDFHDEGATSVVDALEREGLIELDDTDISTLVREIEGHD